MHMLSRNDLPGAQAMFQFDLSTVDNKRIGRMGKIVVELELIARGWLVSSLTPSTASPVGWDFLAVHKDKKRSIKLRVKAKRPGTNCFRWGGQTRGSFLTSPLATGAISSLP